MTIHDVKRIHLSFFPHSYYFSRSSMKAFGQTLRSFGVYRSEDHPGWYVIAAPRRGGGMSRCLFNSADGTLFPNSY
jgi:hypothetical protein